MRTHDGLYNPGRAYKSGYGHEAKVSRVMFFFRSGNPLSLRPIRVNVTVAIRSTCLLLHEVVNLDKITSAYDIPFIYM